MIVDVFMFNDEFDHLKCRLYELEGVVDEFIAIEGNRTMSGRPKPYRLSDSGYTNPSLDIIRADISDTSDLRNLPPGSLWNGAKYAEYWRRDWMQRGAATAYLEDRPDDTIVLFGDLDEIPRRSKVAGFRGSPQRMMMEHLIYSTKWHSGCWTGTVIGQKGDLKTFPEVRTRRDYFPMLHDGGWHLAWLGGEEACVDKVNVFAHGELAEDIDQVRQRFRDKIRPGTGEPLTPYDGDLPGWVRDGHAPDVWTSP